MNSVPSNNVFAKQLGVTFPLLSDFQRKITKEYGVLNTKYGFADRTTFVINKQGIIQHIDKDGVALSPKGALASCSMMEHNKGK